MTAFILDAGVFVAVDNQDRAMISRLRAALDDGMSLRTSAIVIGQVWRDAKGRQARWARLLRAVDVRAVDLEMGRNAGVLIGRAGTDDPIDATVVLIAETGDRILTSDPLDIRRLVDAADKRVAVIAC